jgi:hypothetical protein
VTTNPIARDGVIPNIGRSPEIEAVAFSSPVGTVTNAIATPQGAADRESGIAPGRQRG